MSQNILLQIDSKLIQNVLNRHDNVYICPEMNFYSPYKNGIYNLKHGNYEYPISLQLIKDGRENKVLNKKINSKVGNRRYS